MAVITKGIQLWYGGSKEGATVISPDTYGWAYKGDKFLIPDLQEIGDLVGAEGATRDKIEVTTLADDKHVYTDGILSDGDSDGIEFKLLYSPKSYDAFLKIVKHEKSNKNDCSKYVITIPAGVGKVSQFNVNATTSIKVDGAGVNSAMTMTLTLTPVDVIEFVAEADAIVTE